MTYNSVKNGVMMHYGESKEIGLKIKCDESG